MFHVDYHDYSYCLSYNVPNYSESCEWYIEIMGEYMDLTGHFLK